MTETLLKSILFGFGVYTIMLIAFSPLFPEKIKTKIGKYDNSVCSIIPVIGLAYLFVWFGNQYFQYSNIAGTAEIHQMKSRLIGPYWLSYWFQPSLILSSQLLWFKKLREIKMIRILIALTLIVSIESIVVYLTSLHRDYMPSSWTVSWSSRIYEWMWNLGVFGFVSILFHLMKTKLKK